ncbi:MAG TPA: HAMP domain-containing sensor histidine kinase [Kofleriaceae bacterium]|nr:HAMP domain-containing sensor histidine kinase [Kofleriaceae bacterium]
MLETTRDEDLNLRVRKNAVLRAWARQTPRGSLMVGPVDVVLDELVNFVVGEDGSAESLSAAVEGHVAGRFRDGFTVDAVIGEYALLRRCIHRELGNRRFDHPVDVAIGYAAKHYLTMREELRERFIGVLAHDLRSPLACVTMGTEMLGVDERSEHERSLLKLVLESSDRMRRMVDEILGWAKRSPVEGFPAAQRFDDMAEILQAVAQETQLVHGVDAIELETTGDLRAELDRDRVHQAVVNLVRNAIEHGTGSAHVSASEADGGQTIVLVVRNRGALRSPNASDISQPFERRKRATSSRGLGLYIVDQIARSHGAGLDMTSNLDETAVTIRWPTRRIVDGPSF